MKPLDTLLRKCEKAIGKAKSGESSVEKFAAWLANTLKKVHPAATELREACQNEDWGPGREAAIEALDLYEEGFDECQTYIESEDPEDLDRALVLLRHANEILNKAYEACLETDENVVISWVM